MHLFDTTITSVLYNDDPRVNCQNRALGSLHQAGESIQGVTLTRARGTTRWHSMPERIAAATDENLSTTELKQEQSKGKAERLSPSKAMHTPQHRTAD
jgi:hypothetical protein